MLFRKNPLQDDIPGIIREFRRVKEGDPLPREGACSYFYSRLSDAGQTIVLRDGRACRFFHLEHDDAIQEILSCSPTWHVGIEGTMAMITLLFTSGNVMNRIGIILDESDPNSGRILHFLKRAKKVEVTLLALLYGGIVREKTLVVPVPKEVRTTLGRIKRPAD